MCAGGAYNRRFCAYDKMSAVAAFPNLYLALFKDCRGFNIVEKRAVSLLVALFDSRYKSELLGKGGKALFLGVLCEALVHICPLVVLALCGVKKIFGGVADALKLLKPKLCVLLLVLGGL